MISSHLLQRRPDLRAIVSKDIVLSLCVRRRELLSEKCAGPQQNFQSKGQMKGRHALVLGTAISISPPYRKTF
jgi:hypothetical protein